MCIRATNPSTIYTRLVHTYAEPASCPCDSRIASSRRLRHPAPYIYIADWLHHNQTFTRSSDTQSLVPCTHRFPKPSALESTRAYSNSRLGNPSFIDLMKSCIQTRICYRLYIKDRVTGIMCNYRLQKSGLQAADNLGSHDTCNPESSYQNLITGIWISCNPDSCHV